MTYLKHILDSFWFYFQKELLTPYLYLNKLFLKVFSINCTLYFFHIVRNRVKATSVEPSERQKNIDGLPKES